MEGDNDVLTLKDIKREYGLSRSTMLRRVADKRITPLPKPPGYDRRPAMKFRRADVLAMLAGRGEATP